MKNQKPKYQQIINAAVKVFALYGYNGAQIAKIAEMANVADGTIYLYFKNKEDLLIRLFENKMGGLIENIEQAIKKKNDVHDKLHTLISLHLKLLEEEPDLAIVSQLELRQSKKELREKNNLILKSYFTVIDSLVKEGIKSGNFQRNIEVATTRNFIFGAIDQAVTSWIMKDRNYPLQQEVEPLHQLLLNGLLKKND